MTTSTVCTDTNDKNLLAQRIVATPQAFRRNEAKAKWRKACFLQKQKCAQNKTTKIARIETVTKAKSVDKIIEELKAQEKVSSKSKNEATIVQQQTYIPAQIKVDDYSYFTDEAGRVNKVSGELKLEAKDRNIYQQRKSVEIKNGIKGEDQGGHKIARIFNGPGEQINYVPQTPKLNNGEWKSMENSWKKSLSEGKKIEVDIQIIYDSDKSTKRPLVFFVEYKIDGIEQIPIYHYN